MFGLFRSTGCSRYSVRSARRYFARTLALAEKIQDCLLAHCGAGSTSAKGQKAKYSLGADVFRFAPESGLKSDIAPSPKSATSRHCGHGDD
jgi:hypothetical protein